MLIILIIIFLNETTTLIKRLPSLCLTSFLQLLHLFFKRKYASKNKKKNLIWWFKWFFCGYFIYLQTWSLYWFCNMEGVKWKFHKIIGGPKTRHTYLSEFFCTFLLYSLKLFLHWFIDEPRSSFAVVAISWTCLFSVKIIVTFLRL